MSDLHPEHLIAKAARGQLTFDEQEQLDSHLSNCSVCALLVPGQRDFDALPMDDHDEMLIERFLDEKRPITPARAPIVERWASAAAIVLLFGGGVAAAAYVWTQRTPPSGATKTAPHQGSRETVAMAADAGQEAASVAVDRSPSEARTRSHQSKRRIPSKRQPEKDSAKGSSAAALFEAGNRARRMRQFADAQRTYERLLREHGGSREARVATISLARMLLDHGGAPKEALKLFDKYLASIGRNGPLRAEALSGKARALGRLGDRTSELIVWKQLLNEHPESHHVGVAKDRIGALDATPQ